ncbi:MAG TPA: hypothetical protein VHA55_10675 [Pseudorhodoplanes sp.]|nr:hypothetical protein [Pseudorhodoplanes sp.]
MAKADDTVTLTLDHSVALVLFDFLSRTAEEDEGELLADAIESEAELVAMWSLLAELEEVLTEPFDDNYRRMVDQARARVIAASGTRR